MADMIDRDAAIELFAADENLPTQIIRDKLNALPDAQVTVKPLAWEPIGELFHAFDPLFVVMAISKNPDAYDDERASRIRSALTVTPHDPAKVQALVESLPTTAAERDVLSERSRQCVVEGWDTEHDDIHTEGELAKAAACYAWMAAQSDGLRSAFDRPPPTWPAEWDEYWWKPTTPRRDLVKAAALIIAEIERLDRAALAAMKEV